MTTTEPVGHQHHFLTRLDRLAVPEVELALGLYRDHELLRFLLGELRLPEGAARVAISLDDPREGPFVLVTRDGRFVTCLGRGMKPAHCLVVTRAQLDALSARHERLATARALAAKSGGLGPLLRRLHDAGDAVAREDIAVASALSPLYDHEILSLQLDCTKDLMDTQAGVLAFLRRPHAPGRFERLVFRGMWRLIWMLGHLAVLNTHVVREVLDVIAPERLQRMSTVFSSSAFHTRVLCTAIRGVWSVARIGKALLPNYKQAYEAAPHLLRYTEASLSLSLMGLRHARLRAEVQKTLATLPRSITRLPAATVEIAKSLARIGEHAFEDPAPLQEGHLKVGRDAALDRTSHLPRGSPFRYEHPEDVPEDVARTMGANLELDFVSDPRRMVHLYGMLPWLSRAKAEDFYLPRRLMEATLEPWTASRTRMMLAGMEAEAKVIEAAERAQKAPTRNGPCPCGSGKKYKRCCNAEG
ncbi:MAG TPA: SEC-C metal-binding domain-containing protein [Candidatus Nanopelagicales bacterium]|nr:SEC-C metal-binding domain-containing protein [Candidatus Nanopelagicales bacterium]